MKITKNLAALLAVACAAALLSSCGDASTTEKEPEPTPVAAAGGASEPAPAPKPMGKPLKIAYSDWPGWVAWEIGIKKAWFKEAGVNVQFEWMDYVASMEAYGAGKVDAVCMTNGDALVTGATAKPSVCVVINDYSNGNDMLVAKGGIESVADLKGKKVALEEGFVPHLLVLKALESAGMSDTDITIVNTPTDETPQVLKSDEISAICAWQPNSGTALKQVPGSKPIFTSGNVPGLIYDGLFVSPETHQSRAADWQKVVGVWYQIVEFMKEEDNTDEALAILSERVKVTPDEYEVFLDGTYILSLEEALKVWAKGDSLGSIYGSTKVSDDFNVKFKVYEAPLKYETYLDPSFTRKAGS